MSVLSVQQIQKLCCDTGTSLNRGSPPSMSKRSDIIFFLALHKSCFYKMISLKTRQDTIFRGQLSPSKTSSNSDTPEPPTNPIVPYFPVSRIYRS
jgi:hypothetical protein